MPVLLTREEEFETWLNGPMAATFKYGLFVAPFVATRAGAATFQNLNINIINKLVATVGR